MLIFRRMKIITAEVNQQNRKRGEMAELLEGLEVGGASALSLKTAYEHRQFIGTASQLNRRGLKFRTANGENGTVNVWRVK